MGKQFIITGAKLFLGIDESVIEDGAVWIDGDTIKYAGPAGAMGDTDPSIETVDVGGQFVMPGMSECHAHLSFTDSSPFELGSPTPESATISAVRSSRIMLGSGFTSALSFGSVHKVDITLREAINAGAIPGPRLAAAGKDLGVTASNVDSGGVGGLSQITDGPWNLRQAVRQQRYLNVDIVKIFIDGEGTSNHAPRDELAFHDDEVAAIVDEAHRRNMKVATHSRSADGVKQAVRAGCDYIGHANFLDEEAIEVLHEARDRIFVGPGIAWEMGLVNHHASIGLTREWVTERGYDNQIEASIKSVGMMLEADIRMMVGGDYGISIAPHGTYAKDLEMFVDMFGMTPGKALLCATRDGGAAADPKGRVGTLEAGKFADLIVVNGDPIADIRIMQDHSKLTAIMKGGTIYRDLVNDLSFEIKASDIAGQGAGAAKVLEPAQ
jgi:imidazolonepropionase-like amidohydrolase